MNILEKYQVNSIEDITPQLVMQLIERYEMNEVPRLEKLYEYYLGETEITRRVMADPNKPNNKIVNPFSSLITDTIVGYFAGKPVNYQSEDKELMIKLQDVFDKNHEHTHNKKLTQKLTVMGLAYELLYLNEEAEIGVSTSDPRETFLIYDTTIEENVLAGVRFIDVPDYLTDSHTKIIYVYTDEYSFKYQQDGDTLEVLEQEPHTFKGVPIIQYRNNDDLLGSFERVMSLIDAYDLAVSDTENNLEYFADAYLAITGAEFEDDSDVATMKEERVILLPDGSKAEWLTKEMSQEVEEFKKRLKEDIHQLSQIPNLADESFNNQQSGEALKYKLFGLENLVSVTEGYFKQGIERRIELVTNILNVKSPTAYDYTSVSVVFTRNIPQNLTNLADIASKLVGIVSNETLYTLMPFIDDPALEALRFEKEEPFSRDEFHTEIEELAQEEVEEVEVD